VVFIYEPREVRSGRAHSPIGARAAVKWWFRRGRLQRALRRDVRKRGTEYTLTRGRQLWVRELLLLAEMEQVVRTRYNEMRREICDDPVYELRATWKSHFDRMERGFESGVATLREQQARVSHLLWWIDREAQRRGIEITEFGPAPDDWDW
jgi:hypothetical protein